jgi:hypothetical protein
VLGGLGQRHSLARGGCRQVGLLLYLATAALLAEAAGSAPERPDPKPRRLDLARPS